MAENLRISCWLQEHKEHTRFSHPKYQGACETDSNQSITVCSSCSIAISTDRFAHSRRSFACLRKLKDSITFCRISDCLSALMKMMLGWTKTLDTHRRYFSTHAAPLGLFCYRETIFYRHIAPLGLVFGVTKPIERYGYA